GSSDVCSSDLSGASAGLYLPSLGSTILSETNQPTSVNTNTLAAIKNQFMVTFIVSAYAGSIVAAAAVLNSASITSVPLIRRFAEKPADTPANAAARPAIGCLPSARNMTAPSGGSTT